MLGEELATHDKLTEWADGVGEGVGLGLGVGVGVGAGPGVVAEDAPPAHPTRATQKIAQKTIAMRQPANLLKSRLRPLLRFQNQCGYGNESSASRAGS